MSKLAKLRKGFASGMSEARISDDQWNDEFLPMMIDAERYRWLRDDCDWTITADQSGTKLSVNLGTEVMAIGPDEIEFDSAIDTTRNPTKENT